MKFEQIQDTTNSQSPDEHTADQVLIKAFQNYKWYIYIRCRKK